MYQGPDPRPPYPPQGEGMPTRIAPLYVPQVYRIHVDLATQKFIRDWPIALPHAYENDTYFENYDEAVRHAMAWLMTQPNWHECVATVYDVITDPDMQGKPEFLMGDRAPLFHGGFATVNNWDATEEIR